MTSPRNKKSNVQSTQNPLQQFIQPKAASDLDKVNDFNGDFPLKVAACTGNISSIRQLLAAKASVDNADPIGVTALMMTKDVVIAYELINAKATVDKQDVDGKTALHHAAFAGRNEIVSILLMAKASVCAQDKYGKTPLITSIIRKHYGLIPLLATQESVNMLDCGGETALMKANTVIAVNLLLQARASLEIKDKLGRTALDLAMNNKDIVALLINAGAISHTPDEQYKAMMEAAAIEEQKHTPRF